VPDCSLGKGFRFPCSEQGMHVIVTCTLRTMEEQAALYSQGREPIAAVNTLKAIPGMPPSLLKAVRKMGRSFTIYLPGKCPFKGFSPQGTLSWRSACLTIIERGSDGRCAFRSTKNVHHATTPRLPGKSTCLLCGVFTCEEKASPPFFCFI
jgi:hypothetical protein